MPRLTVGELKTAITWESVLNLGTTDTRWLAYLNQALERLTQMALWDRVVQRYQICANKACITWPRQFIGIEVMDVCNTPFPLRNQWFEFLGNGPGRATLNGCDSNVASIGASIHNVLDRGRGYVMFDDLSVASKIRLYPQFATDVGKKVTIRGYDSNGQQVLTNGGNTVGETIVLQAPYVDSITTWMPQVFREVIKEVTKGHVRAYAWDASLPAPPAAPGVNDTPLTALADWEPTETLPDYRRSFIPYLGTCCSSGGCGCNGTSDQCDKTTVTVMARIQHIPVVSDEDFLPISNISALKLAMLSVMLEERMDWVGSRASMYGTFDPVRKKFVGGAVPLMEEELDAFQGSGTVTPVRLETGITDRAQLTNLV